MQFLQEERMKNMEYPKFIGQRVITPNEYSWLVRFKGQRPMDIFEVQKWKEIFSNETYWDEGGEIKVTEKGEMWYGQHKATALMELNEDFTVLVYSNVTVEFVRSLSTNGRSQWERTDIIHSQAETGDIGAQYMSQFLNKYGSKKIKKTERLPVAVIANAVYDMLNTGHGILDTKRQRKIVPYEVADKELAFIQSHKINNRKYGTTPFLIELQRVYRIVAVADAKQKRSKKLSTLANRLNTKLEGSYRSQKEAARLIIEAVGKKWLEECAEEIK